MVHCPECDYSGSSRGLGLHFYHNDNHKPSFDDEQMEVLTGCLMGDGSVSECGESYHFRIASVNKQYLEHLNNKLGILGLGVKLDRSAEELAEHDRDTGFNPRAKEENYNDLYLLETRVSDELSPLRRWYKSGQKTYPRDIRLSQTSFKYWYCDDGNYDTESGGRIRISCANENTNKEKLRYIFRNSDIPEPAFIDFDAGMNIKWSAGSTEKILEWVGEAPPGFEYKWP